MFEWNTYSSNQVPFNLCVPTFEKMLNKRTLLRANLTIPQVTLDKQLIVRFAPVFPFPRLNISRARAVSFNFLEQYHWPWSFISIKTTTALLRAPTAFSSPYIQLLRSSLLTLYSHFFISRFFFFFFSKGRKKIK